MPKRLLLSALGAVILFMWGFAGHVVIRMYDPVFQRFTAEPVVIAVIEENAPRGGLYYLPLHLVRDGPQAEALVNYVPAGERSGFGAMVLRGLLVNTLAMFLVLTLSAPAPWISYWNSVSRFALAGLIVSFPVKAYYWNWFDFPMLYMVLSVADMVIGWTLAGLLLANLIRRAP